MAVPDSSPEASAVVFVRNPQRLTLADGTFFPPGCCAISWVTLAQPRVQPPKPCRSMGTPVGFFAVFVSARDVSFSWHRQCFSRPRRCRAHISTLVCIQCISRRCSRVSSPRAWAHSRQSGRALRLVCTPLSHPSAGWRGEAPATPIDRVVNPGLLVELVSGDSSGRLCPIR
jgi:hypothetical protein